MDTVLTLPTGVALERLDPVRPAVFGRRVWVPKQTDFGWVWAGDFRLTSDIERDPMDDLLFVRVTDEATWYRWVAHNTDPETRLVRRDAWPESRAWPIDRILLEGSVR